MKENNLKQILNDIGEQAIPDSIDLWSRLEVKLATQTQSHNSRISFKPKSRLGWVMLFVTVLLLFGGTLYATNSNVRNFIHLDPGLESVDLAELGHPLNLSQTIEDTTVILEWAYADANRIALAFSIENNEGQRFDPNSNKLTDTDGTIYRGAGGFGLTGASDELRIDLPPGEGLYLYNFDGSQVTNDPATLNLRFEVVLEEFSLPLMVETPSATVIPNKDGTTTIVTASSTSPYTGKSIGPFVFNFEIPFNTGRIMEPNLVVTTKGIDVRLEKVVVTPSQTAVTLCFDNTDPTYDEWAAFPTLTVNWQRFEAGLISHGRAPQPNCQIAYFQDQGLLYEQTGSVQLRVTELVGFKRDSPEQLRIHGRWNFHFEMP